MQKEIELERASAKLQIQMLERQISESRQAVETEADRVRKLTSEITIKINDPATELSTVIRKNVELAELNSYLKGMQYYLGKCKGR
jgi:chromosome segregation ATPase